MTPFEFLYNALPKCKPQFITPKLAYMAKKSAAVVIKVDRTKVIMLNSNGTWELVTHKELQEMK